MFRLFTLLVLTASIVACTRLIANGSPNPSLANPSMSSSVAVKHTSLIAREQTMPPLGVTSQEELPVKSAAVFVELENLQEADTKVLVQKIEIRNASNGHLELIQQKPQEILLRPLQTSIRNFHLTRGGIYEKQSQVKAIVTLQINGRTHVVESDAIAVEPY